MPCDWYWNFSINVPNNAPYAYYYKYQNMYCIGRSTEKPVLLINANTFDCPHWHWNSLVETSFTKRLGLAVMTLQWSIIQAHMLVGHYTHTHMCKANTYHTPCAPTQPTSSKLVAVNEAADACALCETTALQWTPDTARTTSHWDNLHCGRPEGSTGKHGGKYVTVVLWKHWYLLVPIHSHSS